MDVTYSPCISCPWRLGKTFHNYFELQWSITRSLKQIAFFLEFLISVFSNLDLLSFNLPLQYFLSISDVLLVVIQMFRPCLICKFKVAVVSCFSVLIFLRIPLYKEWKYLSTSQIILTLNPLQSSFWSFSCYFLSLAAFISFKINVLILSPPYNNE